MILQELVACYREAEKPIKGETIASGVGRNAGTIRNQMQSLKALQLVEGIPGPRGGYKPTSVAYDALALEEMGDPEYVPVSHGDEQLSVMIEEIDLTSVLHPENCRAEISIRGLAAERYEPGDPITVGPTPLSELRIDGVIEGIDDMKNTLAVAVEDMQAPVGAAD
jgi:predicted transcriptional regulator